MFINLKICLFFMTNTVYFATITNFTSNCCFCQGGLEHKFLVRIALDLQKEQMFDIMCYQHLRMMSANRQRYYTRKSA